MNKENMKIIQIITHELPETQFVFYFLPNGLLKKIPWNWESPIKPTQSPYYLMGFTLANAGAIPTEKKLPTKVKTLYKFQ